MKTIALKIDVNTEKGTRRGVPNLIALLNKHHIPATFLFSFGPDNTGKTIKCIFRRGFFSKTRSNVTGIYGIRSLINGLLRRGPHIARKHADLMRATRDAGFEVGIHSYDHTRWQDYLHKLQFDDVSALYGAALIEFDKVFGEQAKAIGAAGWQANAHSLHCNDFADMAYASDCRGHSPFFPKIGIYTFDTLQIPTTLATLDERLRQRRSSLSHLSQHYLSELTDGVNVLTLHAELEGIKHLAWFDSLLTELKQRQVNFIRLDDYAEQLLSKPESIPICEIVQGQVAGRSGHVAIQGQALQQTTSAAAAKTATTPA